MNGFEARVMLAERHKGALQACSLPVDNVQRVEVAERAGNFGSVEPGSGLQEDPLPLEMVEELRKAKQAMNIKD